MLREICELLRTRGAMTTCDLAIHFESDESSMEGVLHFLERKRRVYHEELEITGGCAGCRLDGKCTDADRQNAGRLWHAADKTGTDAMKLNHGSNA